MNPYEELSELIGEAADAWLMSGHRVKGSSPEGESATAVIAAGYTKHRTVTTVEELDALAEGTRLYSERTHDFWILNDLSAHGGVKVYGTGGGYSFIHDFIRQQAPLTIMHEAAR